ncbi:uncharacterized protein EHS24_006764 [Apiotrichum porosum]|uniref:Uncharacterized protein n=1 Tax=Apiotrichum porosum TaxID=105984 RepID=A0A427XWC1_9TREE|nr:uncharacterized protein EHS24_006764 [Apiotrichum porosum]RSH83107.1 hypothetical protein EHS24_006764 [Apiotrichum porosum]
MRFTSHMSSNPTYGHMCDSLVFTTALIQTRHVKSSQAFDPAVFWLTAQAQLASNTGMGLVPESGLQFWYMPTSVHAMDGAGTSKPFKPPSLPSGDS